MTRWAAARLRALPGTSAPPYALMVVLAGAALIVSWTIVRFEPTLSLALVGALFAAAVWLAFPESAIYALALTCPLYFSYRLGGLRDVEPLYDAVLMVLMITFAATLPTGSSRAARFKTSLFKGVLAFWAFIAVWESLTFLVAPINQYLLGGSIQNGWHLYRVVFRALLPFPLLVYCLDNRDAGRRVIDMILIISTAIGVYGIWESRQTGLNAVGTFGSKNGFAGYLVLIIPLVVSRLIFERGWRSKILCAGSLIILLRALSLTGSRGGYVACLASFLPLVVLLPRKLLAVWGAAAVLGLTFGLVMIDDPVDRPHVRRFLSALKPNEVRSFEWRKTQWTLLMDRIKESPWVGTGTDVEESLLEMGRLGTAHNGYLSLALRAGVPGLAAWVLFLVAISLHAMRRALKAITPQAQAFWVGFVCLLTALLTHNLVESTLMAPTTKRLVWILTAVAVVYAIAGGPQERADEAAHA